MKNLYKKIARNLDKVDFEKLWPGFKRNDFILYNDTRAYFSDKVVGKPREFYGNTSAKYQGKNVAIWYIKDPERETNIPLLSSKMVHEMFHAFQMDNDELRFARELDGVLYPYSDTNMQIRYEEIKKLLLIFDDFSMEEYKEFISLRLERKEIIGKYFDYEMKIEVIEGLANYVELKALKMIDNKAYEKEIDRIKFELSKIDSTFNIRMSLYYTGALLYLICDRENISFSKQINGEKRAIFDMLKGRIKPSMTHFKNEEVKQGLVSFLKKRGEEVVSILEKLDASPCEDMKLIGFDPLNTISFNNYIYAKNFLVVSDKGTQKYLFGQFVFQINEDEMITKLYMKEDRP